MMTNPQLERHLSTDALWADLEERSLVTFGGAVGLVKMLRARDEHEAATLWAARVRSVLERLGSMFPVSRVGPARFSIDGTVSLQFDIHDVDLLIDDKVAARTLIALDPVALCGATIAWLRWGSRWDERLTSERTPRRVVRQDEPWIEYGLHWVAQNPGGPAPWVSGATEDIAFRAGLSEDIGADRIIELYEIMEVADS
jgi:hypothetical protein